MGWKSLPLFLTSAKRKKVCVCVREREREMVLCHYMEMFSMITNVI